MQRVVSEAVLGCIHGGFRIEKQTRNERVAVHAGDTQRICWWHRSIANRITIRIAHEVHVSVVRSGWMERVRRVTVLSEVVPVN